MPAAPRRPVGRPC